MIIDNILGIGQIISGLAVIAPVVYLAREVSQTFKIVRAQFGHGLTSRLYERYFLSVKDKEFLHFCRKIGLKTTWRIMNIGALPSG